MKNDDDGDNEHPPAELPAFDVAAKLTAVTTPGSRILPPHVPKFDAAFELRIDAGEMAGDKRNPVLQVNSQAEADEDVGRYGGRGPQIDTVETRTLNGDCLPVLRLLTTVTVKTSSFWLCFCVLEAAEHVVRLLLIGGTPEFIDEAGGEFDCTGRTFEDFLRNDDLDSVDGRLSDTDEERDPAFSMVDNGRLSLITLALLLRPGESTIKNHT